MRVLVNQQYHLGHHYQYIEHLLPALTAVVDDVVVAVTPAGQASDQFKSFLAPFQPRVRFEAILPEADPSYAMGERLRVHRDLREVVRTIDPAYVLIPSGDAQATAMAPYRLLGRGSVPGSIPCEIGVHFGTGLAAATASARVRDRLNLLNLALSGAVRIHLVNLLFYEQARSLGRFGRRFVLMPHPVAMPARMTKRDSRHLLGLPEDGRYIGLAASLDARKAVGEFLQAFRSATSAADDRVLLAGRMNQTHVRLIEQQHGDLVKQGRLIVLNAFLDQPTFQAALRALDVVCTPYPRFAGLSSTLLEGVAAGRPILANDFGWSRAIVRRFSLGWTCDVLDHERFSSAIRLALDRSGEYVESEATRRLLRFHTPENFGASWVDSISRTSAQSAKTAVDWQWVEEALPEPMRHLY